MRTLPEVDRFDVVSVPARSRIHGIYREMRGQGPLHRFTDPLTGRPAWLVLNHADAQQVLRDNDTFIRDQGRLMSADERAAWEQRLPPAIRLITSDMVHRDPPQHTRLRALVSKAFTPAQVEGLRARARAIAHQLLDAVDDQDDFDLITSFAFPLPITIILGLLGIDASEQERFCGWSTDMLGDDFARTVTAIEAYRECVDPLIDAREREPGEDMLSLLVHARTDDGSRLSRSELHSMLVLLLIAGHETTVNLIANGTVALCAHPEQRARLVEDPSLTRRAVEELLRYDGPADFASVRYAFVDTELAGYPIQRGDQLFISLLAANRDPEVFEAPDELDVTRRCARAIAFGSGIHACVGAPLARMEALEAFTALLERRPGIELAVDPATLTRRSSRMINAYTALPVRGR